MLDASYLPDTRINNLGHGSDTLELGSIVTLRPLPSPAG